MRPLLVIKVIALLIWLFVYLLRKYSNFKPALTPDDFNITSNLTVPKDKIAQLQLKAGDYLMLELTDNAEVDVVVKDNRDETTVLGTINDPELYYKVRQKIASASIFAISGDIVTVEFKYLN